MNGFVPVAAGFMVVDGWTTASFWLMSNGRVEIGIHLMQTPMPVEGRLIPTLLHVGVNPIWRAVRLTVNLEIAVIEPPVRMTMFTRSRRSPMRRLRRSFAASSLTSDASPSRFSWR